MTQVSSHFSNESREFDQVIQDIADYALSYEIESDPAYETARYCLIDTLGCGLEALEYPACTKLLGPIVPGTVVPNGARRCRGRAISLIRCRRRSTLAR